MGTEPYRLLFPLGILSGTGGIAIWLLFFAGIVSYPSAPHAHVMLFGFFLSFVSGALMTALPHISGGRAASSNERWTAVLLIAAGVSLALVNQFAFAYFFAALQIIFLMSFVARRFNPKQSPPAGFIFVPVGLVWGLSGAILQALAYSQISMPAAAVALGRIAAQEAFLLNLILGLGSRLIPFLTGVRPIAPTEKGTGPGFESWIVFIPLNLSFPVEAAGYYRLAWTLRFVVLVYASIVMFKVHLRRPVPSHLGMGLRLSILMIVLGYALLALLPGHRVALLHLVFIGGFTLMTVMVATRVVLAHGGFPLEMERKSYFVAAAGVLLLACAVTRGFNQLPIAAILWLVAIAMWFFGIGRRALK